MGRPRGGGGTDPAAETPAPARPPSPDDLQLSRWEETRDRLGDEPPKLNIAVNDNRYRAGNAHTNRDHGPAIPLRRDSSVKTIEGRIYGDDGWPRPANGSFRWSDPSTMNRTINDYVSQNWERIRNNLAIAGEHEDVFNAGHRIGEGFVNRGMYGAGPRDARYATTSAVRIVIHLAPGSDPPEPFILTAFPTALG